VNLTLNLTNEFNKLSFIFDENIVDKYNEYNSRKDIPFEVSVNLLFDNLQFVESGFTRLKELENFGNFIKNSLKNKSSERFNFLELNLSASLIFKESTFLKLTIKSDDLLLDKNLIIETTKLLEYQVEFIENLSLITYDPE
jgi:hypothetical protein